MNRNRIKRGLVAACLAMSSVSMGAAPLVTPMVAYAAEELPSAELSVSTEESDSTLKISLADAGIATTGDVVIPETVTYNGVEYKITSIGAYAFSGCTELTSVVIPEGVTSIGQTTFSGCTGLESVVIPKGVKSIEMQAFQNCTGLTSVVIPEGVTSIGSHAFNGCIGLTSVVIPEGVEAIENSVFDGCTGLESVVIPKGVRFIGPCAFNECIGLESVVIPEGVEAVGDYAFANCTGLTSVAFSETFMFIGTYAFDGCTGLTSVKIPSSVEEIGESAFNNCTNLTNITFEGDSISNIGTHAFWVDETLDTTINASEYNSIVKKYDWAGDNRVVTYSSSTEEETPYTQKEITLSTSTSVGSDSNTITPEDAGIDTTGDVVIPEKVTYKDKEYTVTTLEKTFVDNKEITSVVVPDTVTTIDGAFAGCDNLDEVTINSNVEKITEDSFQVDTEKEMTIVTDKENSAVTEYDYAADNIVATLEIKDKTSTPEEGTGNTGDIMITGYVSPITTADVTVPLNGFKFLIDENRDFIPEISELQNNSQFPLDVNALDIRGTEGTEPAIIAADTYTQYQWDNMNKKDTLSKMALMLNGKELYEIFQNDSLDATKAVNIGRLDSGFSGTTSLEVTPGGQYGKNFGNKESELTFVYDLVLEFEVPA